MQLYADKAATNCPYVAIYYTTCNASMGEGAASETRHQQQTSLFPSVKSEDSQRMGGREEWEGKTSKDAHVAVFTTIEWGSRPQTHATVSWPTLSLSLPLSLFLSPLSLLSLLSPTTQWCLNIQPQMLNSENDCPLKQNYVVATYSLGVLWQPQSLKAIPQLLCEV